LIEVTGELFGLKVQAIGKADNLFSSSRKIQVLLYANNLTYSSSNIITIEPGVSQSFDFSFGGNNEIILDIREKREWLKTGIVKGSYLFSLSNLISEMSKIKNSLEKYHSMEL
jgi:hypothetical protein